MIDIKKFVIFIVYEGRSVELLSVVQSTTLTSLSIPVVKRKFTLEQERLQGPSEARTVVLEMQIETSTAEAIGHRLGRGRLEATG